MLWPLLLLLLLPATTATRYYCYYLPRHHCCCCFLQLMVEMEDYHHHFLRSRYCHYCLEVYYLMVVDCYSLEQYWIEDYLRVDYCYCLGADWMVVVVVVVYYDNDS